MRSCIGTLSLLSGERLHAALDEMALDLIRFQPVGSSAGGEQPKFLAVLESGQHVLVKFSPPRGTAYGERWHDLLHAEAWAADVLSEHGIAGTRCSAIRSARRSYLVSDRFDRVGSAGRRHVVLVGAGVRHAAHALAAPSRNGRRSRLFAL